MATRNPNRWQRIDPPTRARPAIAIGPLVVAALSGVVIVGSVGPWATVGPFSANGTGGDGVITLALASLTLVLAVVQLATGGWWPYPVSAFVLIGAAAVGVYHWATVAYTPFADTEIRAEAGWGLVLTTVGAALGAITATVFGMAADTHNSP